MGGEEGEEEVSGWREVMDSDAKVRRRLKKGMERGWEGVERGFLGLKITSVRGIV